MHRYSRNLFTAFQAIGLIIVILGFVQSTATAEEPQTGQEQPNIFLAVADDWGWPHAQAYNDTVVKTPTFERIALGGILFTNAFVSSPSCTPSRNALLTGQYHWRLGSGANLWSSLPDEHITFTNLLEDNGYFVGSYRKSSGPGPDRDRPAAGRQYDSFEEFLDEKPDGKPFCFFSGSSDPHRPYEWQSGIKSGMNPEDVTVPPTFPDTEEVRADICDYYFEVERFDREIGEQLTILEEIGETENTIIVMTGDHGWPFPRGKSNLYDSGTHVPLAIQWTQAIRPNRMIHDFVSLTDLAPTFLEAAGMAPVPEMTGRSLTPLFESRSSGWIAEDRDYVLTGKERHTPGQPGNMGGTPMRAIRTSSYLYIRNFEPDRWPAGGPINPRGRPYADIDNGPTKTAILATEGDPERGHFFDLSCAKRPAEELYDLVNDPHEITNVAGETKYYRILNELRDQLLQELQETNDPRVLDNGDVFDNYPYYGKLDNPPK